MSTLAFQPLPSASEAQRLRTSGAAQRVDERAAARPTVRIGVLLDPDLTAEERSGIPPVLVRLARSLDRSVPEVHWRIGEVRKRGACPVVQADGGLSQLDSAVEALERSRLDFAIVVVPELLEDHRGQPATLLSSQPLACAVASLPRNEPRAERQAVELERRLLRVVGHLAQPSTPRRTPGSPAAGAPVIHARALASNARHVLYGVRRTRPWLLPLRLPRLTAGAVGGAALTMLSTEAWQLGASQSQARLLALCALTLVGASVYLLICQHPLQTLRRHRLGERRVRAEAIACLGLTLGLTVLASTLLGGCLALALGLFPAELVGHWTQSVSPATVCAKVATLSAAVGIAIAALGGSLEPGGHFRFALLVDDARGDER